LQGKELRGRPGNKSSLRLLEMRTVGDGLAYLTYEVVPGR
jgi:hypothetical protein